MDGYGVNGLGTAVDGNTKVIVNHYILTDEFVL